MQIVRFKEVFMKKLLILVVIVSDMLVNVNAELLGPSPYLSFSNSPFNAVNFSWFHFEDFEDGLFNVPGVSAINNNPNGSILAVTTPNFNNESVDADDGIIDGLGRDGYCFSASENDGGDNFGHTYVFNSQVLGEYPTHVGIVWTDGSKTAPTQFEAFDANGTSLGIIGPVHISDNSFRGTTGEDRFFGVINKAGISSFTIRNIGGQNTLAVDHLQYGSAKTSCPTILDVGTVSSNLDIHMPLLNYQSLTGIQNIWADFEYYGQDENGDLLWRLKDFGTNK